VGCLDLDCPVTMMALTMESTLLLMMKTTTTVLSDEYA
jgi:hypothetical protein